MAHWGCFANGKEASSSSWSSHSPSCRTSWFAVLDVWDWSPLAVNEVSHGPGSKEVKTSSLPPITSIMGPEWLLWFCLNSINSEVLN
jgi:hypothetical protein